MQSAASITPSLTSLTLTTYSSYFNHPSNPKPNHPLFILNLSHLSFSWTAVKPYKKILKFLKSYQNLVPEVRSLPKPKIFYSLPDAQKLENIKKILNYFFNETRYMNRLKSLKFLEISPLGFVGNGCRYKEGYVKLRSGNFIFKRYYKRWMVVTDTGVYWMEKRNLEKVTEYLTFCAKVERRYLRQTGHEDGIWMKSANQEHLIRCKSVLRAMLWQRAIEDAIGSCEYQELKLYNSIFPERPTDHVEFFTNGQNYFRAVYKMLKTAQRQVFICDWWLSPEVYLKRPASKYPKSKLADVLKRLAEKGVKIYVHLYKDVSIISSLDSKYSATVLRSLHPNIKVMRHPKHSILSESFLWTHHVKHVCIDQKVTFMGGLDLCFGRMDTAEFKLTDTELPYFFNGIDYSNSRIKGFSNVRDWQSDHIDRKTQPRMPWHDISCVVHGNIAFDIAVNFIQLWNHTSTDYYSIFRHEKKNLLIPIKNISEKSPSAPVNDQAMKKNLKIVELEAKEEKNKSLSVCQLLRSAGAWSYGLQTTDDSIQTAYLSLIQNAKNFIFIENQYFTSATAGKPVKNKIAQALVDKIISKATAGEAFKVIVLIPLMPNDSGDIEKNTSDDLRITLHWEFNTISQLSSSIYGQLSSNPHIRDPKDYIKFYSLRNHSVLGSKPVTEMVYVHTKLMVVDDEIMIIGSANINDRSMLGKRDSEIALVVQDSVKVKSVVNGRSVDVSKNVKEFRIKEFQTLAGEEDSSLFEDPFSKKFDASWNQVAFGNTLVYRKVFGCYPDDTAFDMKGIQRLRSEARIQDYEKEKGKIKGFLVEFPAMFLRDENLNFSTFDLKKLLPMKTFV